MKIKKWSQVILVFFLSVSAWGGEISPISLTFFGIYGAPVAPSALALPTADGLGFNLLAEWNATSYTSLGLGFEQISFNGGYAFTVPMFNFEGRLFPMENERGKFSPYLYGGAGLNLASAGPWQGPVQLKAGIGSKVSIIGPLSFDLAVGSHWLQPPSSFQFVDLRYGLSMAFGFKEKPGAKPAEPPASSPAAPTQVFSPTPTLTAGPTPTVNWTPFPTPLPVESQAATIEIESAPVTTLAGVKKYYRLGMDAFLSGNHPLALKYLRKSLASKEIHGASYYYAETYATLGVIYQFHAHKVKNHNQKALDNYKKALAIDPTTKSAKAYYKKLKAQVARENKGVLKGKTKSKPKSKPKPRAIPTPAEETLSPASADSKASTGL